MKRMELHIALTFAIMFVVGVIINGIESVVSLQSSFITCAVLAKGLFAALTYLLCVWINTRRHPLLTCIGIFGIVLMADFVAFSNVSVASISIGWNWKSIVMMIYYIIAGLIASYQGEKLLEEDKENSISVLINLLDIYGDNSSDDEEEDEDTDTHD